MTAKNAKLMADGSPGFHSEGLTAIPGGRTSSSRFQARQVTRVAGRIAEGWKSFNQTDEERRQQGGRVRTRSAFQGDAPSQACGLVNLEDPL